MLKTKIAQITLLFWLMKIVATTLGETLGDYLSMTLSLGYLTGIWITFCFFVIVLVLQIKAASYKPILFWLVIIATTTLGTEISDFIDRSLHLGYAKGSLFLIAGLLITLLFWYKKYHSLSVTPILEKAKELLFWISVLFSNSLGTAFGDYLNDGMGLSYWQGALLTAAVIIVVVLLHYLTKINQILLFWIAFVFTRPFGATFGDFLTKPLAKGGLDLGTLEASAVAIFVITALIYWEHRQLQTVKQ
ncbi:COG4705 family protein [Flavobacterium sp.]